jgi:hypothetical protein
MPPQCPTLHTSAHSDFVADLAQRGRGDETYVTVKLHVGSRHRPVHRHGRPDSGIESVCGESMTPPAGISRCPAGVWSGEEPGWIRAPRAVG